MKTEIVFVVEDDPDGGLTARAIGEAVFTQADSIEQLKIAVRNALVCHWADATQRPSTIVLKR